MCHVSYKFWTNAKVKYPTALRWIQGFPCFGHLDNISFLDNILVHNNCIVRLYRYKLSPFAVFFCGSDSDKILLFHISHII